jgi:hypothetical protein
MPEGQGWHLGYTAATQRQRLRVREEGGAEVRERWDRQARIVSESRVDVARLDPAELLHAPVVGEV